MNKISVTPVNCILDSYLNSKTIAIYFFLVALAEEKDNEAIVSNVNPNNIAELMQQNNINVSQVQVSISLNELWSKGLISYGINHESGEVDPSMLILIDACIDFESDTINKSKGFIYLSQILISNMFYRLSVRAKRLFIFIYKHFLGQADTLKQKAFPLNILKAETYNKLCHILKVNRYQKIRDAIDEVKCLLQVSCLQSSMQVEVYQFRLNKLFISLLMEQSTTCDHGEVITHSVVQPYKARKTVIKKVKELFTLYSYSPTYDELQEILKAAYTLPVDLLVTAVRSYVKANNKKPIRYIYRYFRKFHFIAL